MTKGIHIKFSDEMVAFLVQNSTVRRNELTALFNKKFGTNISMHSIKAKCLRLGLKTGRTGRIEKGATSWNKGKKGLTKANVTSFKKGNIPHNHKPVGHERITVDGYIEVKVAEPNVFKLKHRITWEQVHGEVPDGCVLVFKNMDKTDCCIENLELITRSELVRLNQLYSKMATPDSNETCILLARLKDKTHKLMVAA